MNELNQFTMENPNICKCGRGNVADGRFPMFYTASGIEFMLKGSELWIELSSYYNSHESWISILLNDDCFCVNFCFIGILLSFSSGDADISFSICFSNCGFFADL